MKNKAWIRILFAIAAIYDLVIGFAFLISGPRIFEATEVPQPNHWGYIQFGALLLMVFGLMFVAIACNPARNRNLIPYGMLLKLSYSGIVGYYWANTGVPGLFKPFVIMDVLMLVLFIVAYYSIEVLSDGN